MPPIEWFMQQRPKASTGLLLPTRKPQPTDQTPSTGLALPPPPPSPPPALSPVKSRESTPLTAHEALCRDLFGRTPTPEPEQAESQDTSQQDPSESEERLRDPLSRTLSPPSEPAESRETSRQQRSESEEQDDCLLHLWESTCEDSAEDGDEESNETSERAETHIPEPTRPRVTSPGRAPVVAPADLVPRSILPTAEALRVQPFGPDAVAFQAQNKLRKYPWMGTTQQDPTYAAAMPSDAARNGKRKRRSPEEVQEDKRKQERARAEKAEQRRVAKEEKEAAAKAEKEERVAARQQEQERRKEAAAKRREQEAARVEQSGPTRRRRTPVSQTPAVQQTTPSWVEAEGSSAAQPIDLTAADPSLEQGTAVADNFSASQGVSPTPSVGGVAYANQPAAFPGPSQQRYASLPPAPGYYGPPMMPQFMASQMPAWPPAYMPQAMPSPVVFNPVGQRQVPLGTNMPSQYRTLVPGYNYSQPPQGMPAPYGPAVGGFGHVQMPPNMPAQYVRPAVGFMQAQAPQNMAGAGPYAGLRWYPGGMGGHMVPQMPAQAQQWPHGQIATIPQWPYRQSTDTRMPPPPPDPHQSVNPQDLMLKKKEEEED